MKFALFYRLLTNKESLKNKNFWIFPRRCMAYVWIAFATIFHGYEVIGIENLPRDGPALIIWYHGALPIDMYFLMAKLAIERDQLVMLIVFLFRTQL